MRADLLDEKYEVIIVLVTICYQYHNSMLPLSLISVIKQTLRQQLNTYCSCRSTGQAPGRPLHMFYRCALPVHVTVTDCNMVLFRVEQSSRARNTFSQLNCHHPAELV